METLRFRGSIFFHSDLAAPWGMSLEQWDIPRFHIALSGECVVGADGGNTVNVEEMDIVLLPNGSSHWIADQAGRELVPSERAGEACELGTPLFQQGPITNRLMCGLVQFDRYATHPILDSLPDILHFPHGSLTEPIRKTVTLIDSVMRHSQTQRRAIVDRLTEILFLQLLDQYLALNPESAGFLTALGDRRIHCALSQIHRRPNFDWSLATLGAQIGMSRATLVRRFRDAIGIAPMAYVSSWRLMKARRLVQTSTMPINEIAKFTGFSSSRTLSRAFKRQFGLTPKECRARNVRD